MPRQAETFFDAMADGYDVLEPWYEHLYATLHAVLRRELTPPADMPRARALDAGCGTGFQAAILDEMGYAVHGLDLSRELLRGARERLLRAPLVQGDVQTLPYRDGGFDAATCCGSTLSYVGRCPAGPGGDRAGAAAGRPAAHRVRRAVEPGPGLGLAQRAAR